MGLVRALGIGVTAFFGFAIGPLMLEGGHMLHCSNRVRASIQDFDGESDDPTGIRNHLWDCAYVADWAMLGPIATLFEHASLPVYLEDSGDVLWLWDMIRVHAIISFERAVTDKIFQMEVQSLYLAFGFPFLSSWGKLNIVLFAFLPAGIEALSAGIILLRENRWLTVILGILIIVVPVGSYLRIIFAFVCKSEAFNTSSLSCVVFSDVGGNLTELVG